MNSDQQNSPKQNYGKFFDIKRFAIHDGPGIRTTFFMQGCPLDCWWCHNPEGIPLAMPDMETRNGECSLRKLTVDELLNEAEKDRVFMEESGGGVTFSGGEPLVQIAFLVEACSVLKDADFHIAVDTSGYADVSAFQNLENLVDLFLYDLKIVDDEAHRKFTGVSVQPVLYNLEYLMENGAAVWLRIPIVSGITDRDVNLESICECLKNRTAGIKLSLMPYHKGGASKYGRLGLKDRMEKIEPPSRQRLEEVRKFFEEKGFDVDVGG